MAENDGMPLSPTGSGVRPGTVVAPASAQSDVTSGAASEADYSAVADEVLEPVERSGRSENRDRSESQRSDEGDEEEEPKPKHRKKAAAKSVEQVALEQVAAQEGVSVEELKALQADEVAYSWEASEYVHHHKGAAWYVGLAAIVIVLVGVAAYVHSWLTIATFLVMAAAIVVYARKPPRVLLYELGQKGIIIDGREYPYSTIRSFGVISDTEWHAINLEPAERFMPQLTVLFEDDDLEPIVSHLELHLPRIDRDLDMIDRVSRYLRF